MEGRFAFRGSQTLVGGSSYSSYDRELLPTGIEDAMMPVSPLSESREAHYLGPYHTILGGSKKCCNEGGWCQ